MPVSPDELWSKVDEYLGRILVPEEEALHHALETSAAAGLPAIQVAPNQGAFLMLLARMIRARSILEIGTLGGYSTIWLARGLEPGGKLVTLEYEPRHATVAQANLDFAGLSDVVTVLTGRARDAMVRMIQEGAAPFDFIFIDGDKPALAEYFDLSLQLSHPGTVLVLDNVVREGNVLTPGHDANVDGVRRLFERMRDEPRITATALQTVGSKGHDGFAIAVVR
jgi:predicted O-methyltransferase YrrM